MADQYALFLFQCFEHIVSIFGDHTDFSVENGFVINPWYDGRSHVLEAFQAMQFFCWFHGVALNLGIQLPELPGIAHDGAAGADACAKMSDLAILFVSRFPRPCAGNGRASWNRYCTGPA